MCLKFYKQKGCPQNGQPVFSGMKNYAFHLAQGDISIRMLRMAMVIGTIGKAEVNFMCASLLRTLLNGKQIVRNSQGLLVLY